MTKVIRLKDDEGDMAQVGQINLAEEVIGVLQNRQPQAAFVTEVAATIHPTPQKADMEAVLRELGGEGRVLVADYASPDPHLDATGFARRGLCSSRKRRIGSSGIGRSSLEQLAKRVPAHP